jgi:hypothetical protein
MIGVVLAALLFWACVFAVYLATQGQSPADFLLGRAEAPPQDLGIWKELGLDPSSQLMREERLVLLESGPRAGQLLRQVRYVDPLTRAVVGAESEQRVPRRRR